MQCYNGLKYRLLGYNRAINRYILTNAKYQDNEICVEEAIIENKANNEVVRLSKGNLDNAIKEIGMEVFSR